MGGGRLSGPRPGSLVVGRALAVGWGLWARRVLLVDGAVVRTNVKALGAPA